MGAEDDMMKLMGFSGFGQKAKPDQEDHMKSRVKDVAARADDNVDMPVEGDSLPAKAHGQPARPRASAHAPKSTRAEAGSKQVGPQTAEGVSPGAGPADVELPCSHELVISGHHTRTITALAVDRTGLRFVTGSSDNKARMYDFNGMTTALRSYREMEPSEGHPVVSLSFSPNSELLLAVTGSPQPKLYDREGHSLGEFPRGDMYIRDMRNTKGHVSSCTGGSFHPADRGKAMTSSVDGTVRLWDCWALKQTCVIKPALSRPGRVHVTACAFDATGNRAVGGLSDGCIQIWDLRGSFGRSAAVGQISAPRQQMVEKQDWRYLTTASEVCRGAHKAEEDVSGLLFCDEGHQLASRCCDGTLKVWDTRALKCPIRAFGGLPAACASANVAASPLGDLLLTGVGTGEVNGTGEVVVIDRVRLELQRRLAFPAPVTCVLWHPIINQVIVGTGDRKRAACHVLYDPDRSSNGALLAARKAPRRVDLDWTPPVVERQHTSGPRMTYKRKMQMDTERALKTRKPDSGLSLAAGKGREGRVGSTPHSMLKHHLLQKGSHVRDNLLVDARDAILQHKVDEGDIYSRAYKDTQPQPVYEASEDEDDASR
ncbi:unnamed protein product [Pedinophyceae sp. YPF-701]|nr:unnamed protein product [Pedinophyceae sp. YPF-701]